jgi:tetratricopeptide (TPR) repeat protein
VSADPSGRLGAKGALDRAAVLVELGRFSAAIDALTAALAADPTNTRALCVLSNAHLGAGRPAEALAAAWAAAAADPTDEWPHRLASRARANQGMWRDAADEAREAIRLAPTASNAFVLLAEAELAMRNLPAARAAADQAVALSPALATPYSALAAVALKQRDNGGAERACQAALRLEPNTAWALNNLGVVCVRRRKLLRAVRYFVGALRADPTQGAAQRNVRALRIRLVRLAVAVALIAAGVIGYNDSAWLPSGSSGTAWPVVAGLMGAGLAALAGLAAVGWRRHHRIVRAFLAAGERGPRPVRRWRWGVGLPVALLLAALVGHGAAQPLPRPVLQPPGSAFLPLNLLDPPQQQRAVAVVTGPEARRLADDLTRPVTDQTLDQYRHDAAALKFALDLSLPILGAPSYLESGPADTDLVALADAERALQATLARGATASAAEFQLMAPELAAQLQTARQAEEQYLTDRYRGAARPPG